MTKKDGIYGMLCALVTLATSFNAQNLNCQSGKSAQPPMYYSAENLRSDTFNILKYTINLEIGSTANSSISGNTMVRFAPKLNNRTFLRLDLLELTVDSVKEGGSLLTHTYNDTILRINFLSPKNVVDTSMVTVFYHGAPVIDVTGWGGFYFNNTQSAQYAFNLGVGFGAKPHNYGRVWFPCFDNFVERSKYEFNITSDSARKAYCNGQLVSDVINGSNRTRQWILNEEIPTYLASVSLAKYTQVNWTVNTLNGLKPITLVGVPSDTTAMKSGFVNLKTCINGFENYFGPYKWNRFGYCLVPFNGGAMEHATNITYPRNAIGNLNFEADLMAHELSHHWWGDLITCETQEDMWINEGMATFSSYMFTEWKYGREAYLNKVKTEHDQLLHFLHHNEGGFRAVSGVPHSLTYGDHVYKKGADVAHTLRGYMGDTAFFDACKYTMQQNAFKSINSNEMKNLFQTSSGQNLNDFFTNWILSGGWSHFAIDSVRYLPASQGLDAVVYLKQKIYGAPALHSNVPLELSFFKQDWSRVTKRVVMSGATASFTVNIPFTPQYCAVNHDGKINDATSAEVKTIKTAANISYSIAKVYLQVQNSGADSSMLRIIHNYVKPDPFKNNPAQSRLSDQHFWRIEGILSPGFHTKARFNYDGTKTTAGTYAYMDTSLTATNDDSLGIFFRLNASDDWALVKHYSKFASGGKTGFIEVDTLKIGEYAFGNVGDTAVLNIPRISAQPEIIKVYPNPSAQKFAIELSNVASKGLKLTLINVDGQTIHSSPINNKTTYIQTSQFAKGTYFLKVEQDGKTIHVRKLVFD
ncbi:MAG: T9SS type A sorting domain-containing protein [Bacteroidia bacterium]|nr:T9SS type A sorting domain-containing protein [Bacteroidia bacterium]